MEFDAAVALLRSWEGQAVEIVLAPDGTVMRGCLREREADGIDGALFVVDGDTLTGIALALFRDGMVSAALGDDGALVVEQGRVTARVARSA